MILIVSPAEKRKIDEEHADGVCTHVESPFGQMKIVVSDELPPAFWAIAVRNQVVIPVEIVA